MIASVLLAIAGVGFGIIPYLAVSKLITRIFEKNYTWSNILYIALIALIGYFGKVVFSTLSTILSHRSAFIILKSIRQEITEKLSKVPMGYIEDTSSGKFKTVIVDTVEKIELPLAHMIPELTSNLLIPICLTIYFFMLDWRLALIALATIPIGLICYMGMMIDYETRYGRVLKAGKNMDATIVEYINGIEVIKMFNQSARSYKKYIDSVEENSKSKIEWFKKTNGFYIIAISIMPTSLVGVLPLGTYLYMNGSISIPVLITCIILSMSLIKPLIQALEYTDSLAMVDSTVKEIADILQVEEMKRPQYRKDTKNNTITFDNVSFAYDEVQVLKNISFSTIPSGITAIVGPSGSGKSTIAKLIASFWEANQGSIKLGDVDVKELPLAQIMDTTSYVSQDNFLFNLSIRENIRLGNKKATDKEVEIAAKKASAHEFIMTLPKGYDTNVGDAGGKLSGGERQRIAIARAILKDAPIVLLDEATAFTDPENENRIQNSINQLIKDKTLIVIAHRLSTIINADQIIVMNNGQVEGIGDHISLLKSCKLYKDLWEAHISYKDSIEEAS
ncbi:ABC transporter ATP-binding protein [Vallitalea guaymasensis]|uniref:ABC transporter ATP-binding protein n=2 Tax=Vallitalea guaymasensis TaxID=1185412 RepID=A0A8J8SEU8_9FIRM|nr:ABC transporter ATP-binding protein [Vallitalea guaymasensis]